MPQGAAAPPPPSGAGKRAPHFPGEPRGSRSGAEGGRLPARTAGAEGRPRGVPSYFPKIRGQAGDNFP